MVSSGIHCGRQNTAKLPISSAPGWQVLRWNRKSGMGRAEVIEPMDLPRSSLDSGDPKGNDRVFLKNSDVIAVSAWEGRRTFSKK